MLPDRDFTLSLFHDKQGERIEIEACQPIAPTLIKLDLHGGDITIYPLDTYYAGLSSQRSDASALSDAQAK